MITYPNCRVSLTSSSAEARCWQTHQNAEAEIQVAQETLLENRSVDESSILGRPIVDDRLRLLLEMLVLIRGSRLVQSSRLDVGHVTKCLSMRRRKEKCGKRKEFRGVPSSPTTPPSPPQHFISRHREFPRLLVTDPSGPHPAQIAKEGLSAALPVKFAGVSVDLDRLNDSLASALQRDESEQTRNVLECKMGWDGVD